MVTLSKMLKESQHSPPSIKYRRGQDQSSDEANNSANPNGKFDRDAGHVGSLDLSSRRSPLKSIPHRSIIPESEQGTRTWNRGNSQNERSSAMDGKQWSGEERPTDQWRAKEKMSSGKDYKRGIMRKSEKAVHEPSMVTPSKKLKESQHSAPSSKYSRGQDQSSDEANNSANPNGKFDRDAGHVGSLDLSSRRSPLKSIPHRSIIPESEQGTRTWNRGNSQNERSSAMDGKQWSGEERPTDQWRAKEKMSSGKDYKRGIMRKSEKAVHEPSMVTPSKKLKESQHSAPSSKYSRGQDQSSDEANNSANPNGKFDRDAGHVGSLDLSSRRSPLKSIPHRSIIPESEQGTRTWNRGNTQNERSSAMDGKQWSGEERPTDQWRAKEKMSSGKDYKRGIMRKSEKAVHEPSMVTPSKKLKESQHSAPSSKYSRGQDQSSDEANNSANPNGKFDRDAGHVGSLDLSSRRSPLKSIPHRSIIPESEQGTRTWNRGNTQNERSSAMDGKQWSGEERPTDQWRAKEKISSGNDYKRGIMRKSEKAVQEPSMVTPSKKLKESQHSAPTSKYGRGQDQSSDEANNSVNPNGKFDRDAGHVGSLELSSRRSPLKSIPHRSIIPESEQGTRTWNRGNTQNGRSSAMDGKQWSGEERTTDQWRAKEKFDRDAGQAGSLELSSHRSPLKSIPHRTIIPEREQGTRTWNRGNTQNGRSSAMDGKQWPGKERPAEQLRTKEKIASLEMSDNGEQWRDFDDSRTAEQPPHSMPILIADLLKNHKLEDHIRLLMEFKEVLCDGCWSEALRVAHRYIPDVLEDEDSLQMGTEGARALPTKTHTPSCSVFPVAATKPFMKGDVLGKMTVPRDEVKPSGLMDLNKYPPCSTMRFRGQDHHSIGANQKKEMDTEGARALPTKTHTPSCSVFPVAAAKPFMKGDVLGKMTVPRDEVKPSGLMDLNKYPPCSTMRFRGQDLHSIGANQKKEMDTEGARALPTKTHTPSCSVFPVAATKPFMKGDVLGKMTVPRDEVKPSGLMDLNKYPPCSTMRFRGQDHHSIGANQKKEMDTEGARALPTKTHTPSCSVFPVAATKPFMKGDVLGKMTVPRDEVKPSGLMDLNKYPPCSTMRFRGQDHHSIGANQKKEMDTEGARALPTKTHTPSCSVFPVAAAKPFMKGDVLGKMTVPRDEVKPSGLMDLNKYPPCSTMRFRGQDHHSIGANQKKEMDTEGARALPTKTHTPSCSVFPVAATKPFMKGDVLGKMTVPRDEVKPSGLMDLNKYPPCSTMRFRGQDHHSIGANQKKEMDTEGARALPTKTHTPSCSVFPVAATKPFMKGDVLGKMTVPRDEVKPSGLMDLNKYPPCSTMRFRGQDHHSIGANQKKEMDTEGARALPTKTHTPSCSVFPVAAAKPFMKGDVLGKMTVPRDEVKPSGLMDLNKYPPCSTMRFRGQDHHSIGANQKKEMDYEGARALPTKTHNNYPLLFRWRVPSCSVFPVAATKPFMKGDVLGKMTVPRDEVKPSGLMDLNKYPPCSTMRFRGQDHHSIGANQKKEMIIFPSIEPIQSCWMHSHLYPENHRKVFAPSRWRWNLAPHVYVIEFSIGFGMIGRVLIQTSPDRVPVPSATFATLCAMGNMQIANTTYRGCNVFEVVKGKYITTGINQFIDGTYGKVNCGAKGDITDMKVDRGSVAMVYGQQQAVRKLTCQFKIYLDVEQNANAVVFGRVVSGLDAVERIAALDVGNGKPGLPIYISYCGMLT